MDSCLRQLYDDLDTLLREISQEQLSRQPGIKWSAAEILEHLYLTYTGTIKGFERLEQAGNPKIKGSTLAQKIQAVVVITLGYFPSGRQSPAVATPRGLPREQVVLEILSRIAEMDVVLSRCEQKFGSRTKVLDHPVLGSLSVSQWRKFHLVHGRHHLKQIVRVRRQPNT